jgi:N-acyl-D-aspartate/D-glutamate deacylase
MSFTQFVPILHSLGHYFVHDRQYAVFTSGKKILLNLLRAIMRITGEVAERFGVAVMI